MSKCLAGLLATRCAIKRVDVLDGVFDQFADINQCGRLYGLLGGRGPGHSDTWYWSMKDNWLRGCGEWLREDFVKLLLLDARADLVLFCDLEGNWKDDTCRDDSLGDDRSRGVRPLLLVIGFERLVESSVDRR